MELDNTQAVTSGIPSQRKGEQKVAAAEHARSLEEVLHRLEANGWVVLRDLVTAGSAAQPVSFVLLGSRGIVVMETSPRFATSHRDAFLGAAGSLAATLPADHRKLVTSALVLLGGADDVVAQCSTPAAIDTVPVDQLELWLVAHSAPVLEPEVVASLSGTVVKAWSDRAGTLLTADQLPEESDCVTEASLRRGRDDNAKRGRWVPPLKGQAGRASRDRNRKTRAAAAARPVGARPDFTMTDMIRIALVTFAVVVGIWFITVISDTVGSSTGGTATKSPVTSSQVGGPSTGAPDAQTGGTGTSPNSASK